jgi:hypothetical protein
MCKSNIHEKVEEAPDIGNLFVMSASAMFIPFDDVWGGHSLASA